MLNHGASECHRLFRQHGNEPAATAIGDEVFFQELLTATHSIASRAFAHQRINLVRGKGRTPDRRHGAMTRVNFGGFREPDGGGFNPPGIEEECEAPRLHPANIPPLPLGFMVEFDTVCWSRPNLVEIWNPPWPDASVLRCAARQCAGRPDFTLSGLAHRDGCDASELRVSRRRFDTPVKTLVDLVNERTDAPPPWCEGPTLHPTTTQ